MSNVILDEAGLTALLSTREGAVGRELERRAEHVRAQADANIDLILARAPAGSRPRTVAIVEETGFGVEATVELIDEGPNADYLGKKAQGLVKPKGPEAFPTRGWFGEALAKGFDEA